MITEDQLRRHALWLQGAPDGERLVLSGSNLRDADLNGADLRGANLNGADLLGADLRGSNLLGSNLRDANLRGADLRGSNLNDADLNGADLRGANLRGSNLLCADLRGAAGLLIADDAPARLLAVARAALQPGALEMGAWHTCETTHSMSGWAVHQAGEPGKILESAVGSHMAGLHLLGPEAALHFYDSNEKATEYLRGVIAAAEQGGQADV